MLEKPPKYVQQSLSAKINGIRLEGKPISFVRPKTAAIQLKTKEDQSLCYGDAKTEFFAVPVVVQVTVWAVTVIALAAGGSSQGASSALRQLPNSDIFEMTIDELLNERRTMME